MAELDVSHFRQPVEELPLPANVDSDEAPTRPQALDSQDDIPDSEPTSTVEAEILPPALVEPTPHYAPFAKAASVSFQRIDFGKIQTREDLMRSLNESLPLNEFNLPKYFYRPDMLDHYKLSRDQETERSAALDPTMCSSPPTSLVQQHLEQATVFLDYHHSYPTLKDGTAFWCRLDWEGSDAFTAFSEYLSQGGVRTLHGMPAFPKDLLNQWYHLYCWGLRARAYDMYRTMHHMRMRAHRIMHTEDNHYLESEKAFNKVVKAFDSIDEKTLSDIEPDKLVKMMEALHRMQRVSAGLPASNALDESKAPKQVSVEVTARQVAANEGRRNEDDNATPLEILGNPDALAAAQELIVKIHSK
jgi:hypothetical protein